MGTPSWLGLVFTLDTNVLIYYAAGDTAAVNFLLGNLEQRSTLFLSTIAVVELFSYPAITDKERYVFERLLPQLSIIPPDFTIALRAAELRKQYRLKLGDSVIAATALITRSSLVTRNVRDFRNIPILELRKI